jgi:hypothetical protein
MERSGHFRRLDPAAQTAFRDAMSHATTDADRAAIRHEATSDRFGQLGRPDQASRAAEIRNAVSDSRFAGLNPELRSSVVESAATGRGTSAELMDAATFTPGAGLAVVGTAASPADRAADEATFTNMLRRSMVRSPTFRAAMQHQNGETANPVEMRVGRHLPRVFVDASGEPRSPGIHEVDLADIERFPRDPGRGPHPNATTQDQNVVHFMEEAIREAHGNRSPQADDFDAAHASGIHLENAYRRDVGQSGTIEDVHDRRGQAVFRYHGHRDERVPTTHNDITGPIRYQ